VVKNRPVRRLGTEERTFTPGVGIPMDLSIMPFDNEAIQFLEVLFGSGIRKSIEAEGGLIHILFRLRAHSLQDAIPAYEIDEIPVPFL
jgi:hypothetical protein